MSPLHDFDGLDYPPPMSPSKRPEAMTPDMLYAVEPLPGSVATLCAILQDQENTISVNARRMLVTVLRTLEQRTADAQRQTSAANDNVLRIRDEANERITALTASLSRCEAERDALKDFANCLRP